MTKRNAWKGWQVVGPDEGAAFCQGKSVERMELPLFHESTATVKTYFTDGSGFAVTTEEGYALSELTWQDGDITYRTFTPTPTEERPAPSHEEHTP